VDIATETRKGIRFPIIFGDEFVIVKGLMVNDYD
jgi:hypothetical protein